MKKIGLFGGTFDPPHNGHLLMANEVRFQVGLDEMWFIPNHKPPHKTDRKRADSRHRVKMVEAAIQSNPHFRLELIEMEREGPSYTVDTVELLKKRHPEDEFFFMIGADMVEYLPKWHRIADLLQMITFIGMKRPGYAGSTAYPLLFADVPAFDVSSTLIRQRIKQEKPVDYLIPKAVERYIKEHHLYES
ncbi:nicotinate-nucleotide adenylyltransferase [Bacillus pumilus]|uniref:nicotinate-nucleotide adenylyltransferase n=1 Tax=Bacillus TaxID=1386 RepID=UPI001B8431CB|nr:MULTISPECIES: nicotinate-nucleotide adenylyltransferase [Bacillus]MBR0619794.1 nicotinate-nucleotide adenylyltransferase [Bacillus pumilus]MCW6698338.1 nicotinate-nucleotide adenylyltransferase [Bacillus sp. RP12]